jgi:pantoate--beta-alanine ligase
MTRTVTTPVVAATRGELAKALAALRVDPADPARRRTIALVPTMGALHHGHRQLMRRAADLADVVVVSVFVNPLQFGAGEDFDRYPRTFEADLAAAGAEGVDLVFAPTPAVMYPGGAQRQAVTVSAGPVGDAFEGRSRPGHFDGVLTVVAKLFHLVGPDVAVFGEKDAQQLVLIRRMVGDLDLPVHIVGAATVREADGLAMSSRNAYLSPTDRAAATVLHRALRAGTAAAGDGPRAVLVAARSELAAAPEFTADYVELVDAERFSAVDEGYAGAAILILAGWIGGVRLLDNLPIVL